MRLPTLKFSLAQPAAGLVIRAEEVELLAMRGRAVAARVRVPLEGKDDAHLIQAIQKALETSAVKTRKLAVAIPTKDVLFRFFTMPVIPKGEWEAAVQFEARKYIPFKPDELVWDYRVLQSDGAEKTLDVVFAAIQRQAFERLHAVLAAAGLQPTMVEPRSLSLARLVQSRAAKAPSAFVCVVDVEGDAAHLAMIKDGLPYLARDINLAMSVDASKQGLASAAAVDARAQRLLSELNVSLDFFVREYPAAQRIEQVVLFGDETVLGPWCQGLSESLRCTVELGNRFLDERIIEGELPLSAAAVVGLLQAKHQSAKVSLDFLKRSQIKPSAVQPARVLPTMPAVAAAFKSPQTVIAGALFAVVLLGLWWQGSRQIAAARQRLAHVVAARPTTGWRLEGMGQVELAALQAKAAAAAAFLKRTMDARVSVAQKLDALARSLPDGVWFTGLTFQDQPSGDGHSQFSLIVRGACFLPEAERELNAIQEFEQQVKHNAQFFRGFRMARLDQINAQVHAQADQQYTYRTFLLNCAGEGS